MTNLGLDSVECDCGSRIEAAKVPSPPNAFPNQDQITSTEAFNLIRLAVIAGEAAPLADYNALQSVRPISAAAIECTQKVLSGYCSRFLAVELTIDGEPRRQLYPRGVYSILREEDRPPVIDQYGVVAVTINTETV